MKRIKIIAILIIVMITNLILINNYSIAKVEDVQGKLSVTSSSGKVEEKVTVKVIVKSDISLDNDNLLLEFDKTKLKYETSSVATIANTMIMGGNRENHSSGADGFSIVMTSAIADKVTIPANTELATVTFTILKGTTSNQELRLVHYKGKTRTELASTIISVKQDESSKPTPTPQITSTPSPKPTVNPTSTPEPSKPTPPITTTPSPKPTTTPTSKPSASPTSTPKPDKPQEGETEKIKYTMLEGNNCIWKYGDKNLFFKSNADFSKFVNIIIDGAEVSKEYYNAKSGSTIIEVKEKYLKTLSTGTHEIIINSKDGSATAKFKIEKGENDLSSKDETEAPEKKLPQTGEKNNTTIFILTALAFTVALALYYMAKKEKNSKI